MLITEKEKEKKEATTHPSLSCRQIIKPKRKKKG